MMTIQAKPHITQADFEAFVNLPENSEKILELISGEVVEVPSNPFVSEIASLIGFFIRLFLRQNNLRGHVTGADGGYIINNDVYAPDVGYISYDRQPELAQRGFNPAPPELAVEVISDPNNSHEQAALRRKIVNYLAAGTVVWVVDTFERTIEVYDGMQQPKIYGAGDTLPGGAVLPGFELPVKDIFPQEQKG